MSKAAAKVKSDVQPIRRLHAGGVWGDQIPNQSTVTLDFDGKHLTGQAVGNGPIDAAFRVIQQLVPHQARMTFFDVKSQGTSSDALGKAFVTLESDKGGTFHGQATDPNILIASIDAYLGALNNLRYAKH